MPNRNDEIRKISRRALLKSAGFAPLLLRPAPFWGASMLAGRTFLPSEEDHPLHYTEARFKPHYPASSPLKDILDLVAPGSDGYVTEKYAVEIEALLNGWGEAMKASLHERQQILRFLPMSLEASALTPVQEIVLRAGFGIDATRRTFGSPALRNQEDFLKELHSWLGQFSALETTEFEIYRIAELGSSPLKVRVQLRYDLVGVRKDARREERVGSWQMEWSREEAEAWTVHRWEAAEEIQSLGEAKAFLDVTKNALGSNDSYERQMMHGVDYWRTTLDGASGMDVYANNGVAAGDYDNDGFDDFYVCQPAGLPNRLYRNRGDGTFEDVTERAGVAVLDNTACALFADFDNRGLQDLLVVCGTGPLLFVNQGDGTFALKHDAFQFARAAEGTFTHAAVADYDGDGRLDVYFCTYMYYLGLDQYHYPTPYYDARNGPPNCLFHNEGNGIFVETTKDSGLDVENNRYSFACAWGNASTQGKSLPDLTIANDFGVSQLYRNNGDGTFTVASEQSHIQDVGAGMSAAWADFDNDGKQDIYIASMWEAAGQRVSQQTQFQADAPQSIRKLYQRHAEGNALYRNVGDGTFENIGQNAGVAMGRWSWCSDFWDFDHDGYSDLYVANGYISAVDKNDVASFFWRQVVAKSPEDTTPSTAYERGWSAMNELIRSDNSWNAYERNVLFANNRNGTFSEVSGVVGLDFLEDSRSFALADIDHDGRLEVILRNRNAPQLRILHNAMSQVGGSISFRLRGHKSNRDAIGAAITVDAGTAHQTKSVQAGSGFLAQHTKELFFGIGNVEHGLKATVRWPSGLVQAFDDLPANHRIEIEEGLETFKAQPFGAAPAIYSREDEQTPSAALPKQVETWLMIPLRAPEFVLTDTSGSTVDLGRLQGNSTLLSFWAVHSTEAMQQLQDFHLGQAKFQEAHLQIVAMNIDEAPERGAARSAADAASFSFPTVFASDEVAGVYNIIYRYLFDRRRDLGFPTSFLVDPNGMMIKVYQGFVGTDRVLEDMRTAPKTAAERIERALPFRGKLFQGSFQRNVFTYGVAMFQHGYFDQAAESFQEVIAARPNDAEAYYNLGTLNLRRNRLAEARQYLEQTVKLRPNYPEAWNNLGMISAQEGDADGAVTDFQHALALRPAYDVALLNLGNVYRRRREFGKAEECLTHALELRPDDPDINYSIGMLNAQQNQMQAAVQYLQRAIQLRPAYPEALNNLGIVFVRLQKLSAAEDQFKTGIRLAPENDQAYLNLARLYAIENDKERAREVLQELLKLQPTNPTALQALDVLR